MLFVLRWVLLPFIGTQQCFGLSCRNVFWRRCSWLQRLFGRPVSGGWYPELMRGLPGRLLLRNNWAYIGLGLLCDWQVLGCRRLCVQQLWRWHQPAQHRARCVRELCGRHL